jgi:hypothetical protein
MNREDWPAMIMEYDTTFNLGKFSVSWSTFMVWNLIHANRWFSVLQPFKEAENFP